jgi:hypothetical protein
LHLTAAARWGQVLFKEVKGINHYKKKKVHSSDGLDMYTGLKIKNSLWKYGQMKIKGRHRQMWEESTQNMLRQ